MSGHYAVYLHLHSVYTLTQLCSQLYFNKILKRIFSIILKIKVLNTFK